LTLAREIEGALKGDMTRGKYDIHVRRKVKTLDEVFKEYIAWAKENRKAWENNQNRYNQFVKERFGKKRLDQITPFSIEKFKSELKKKKNRLDRPYATDTINQHIYIIRRLFNFAIKRGWFNGQNPVANVNLSKPKNEIIRYLTDDELKRLLNTLDTWPYKDTADIVRFALLTGFRRGEILGLRWENVDLENGYIHHPDPKGGKPDTIPVSSEALDIIREREPKEGLVFVGSDGKPRYDFKGPPGRIFKAAGIENFRFHDLRHNFASRLINKGVALPVIQKLLSHKDYKTTLKYAHLAPDAVKDAAKASSKFLSEPMAEKEKAAENE
jgi:integrase